MSASLVGSEMCIRDRSSCPRPVGPPRQGSAQARCAWPCRACKAGPRTVSYTHLTLPTICSV
eukprot:6541939-Alexandrium_andersonii.AAC.1